MVLVCKVLTYSIYKLLGTTNNGASFDLKDNDVGLNILHDVSQWYSDQHTR